MPYRRGSGPRYSGDRDRRDTARSQRQCHRNARRRIASRGVEIHENVDVAIGGGVTTGDGSEEPRIAGSVAPQDLVQLLTAGSDGFRALAAALVMVMLSRIGAKTADDHQ